MADQEQAEHAKLLEEKLGTIGGTDASVIALETAGKKPAFGRSMFDVWLRMTGRAPPREDNDRLEMGRLMEEPIATRFSRRTGLQVEKIPQVVHPRFPWVTGHIDRAIVGGQPADLECKSVEWDPLHEWSDPALGEEQRVPLDYLLQITWYVGIPRGDLGAFERMMYAAAQFGLSGSLRIYKWWPDEKIQQIHARMLESCQRFYEENVLKNDPPPMPTFDGDAARRWLAFKHPTNKDREIAAISDSAEAERMVTLVHEYEEAQAKAKLYSDRQDLLGAELGRLVGDHYGAMAISGGETAKATRPFIEPSTKVITDYRAILQELDVEVPPEIEQKHTSTIVTRAGYRRLSVAVGPTGTINTKVPKERK